MLISDKLNWALKSWVLDIMASNSFPQVVNTVIKLALWQGPLERAHLLKRPVYRKERTLPHSL